MLKASAFFAVGALALQAPEHEDISFSPITPEFLVRHEGGTPTFLDATMRSEDAEVIARESLDRLVGGDWSLLSRYSTRHNGVTHLAFRQMIHGLECENCDAVVNINAHGQVVNIGHSAVKADAALRATHYANATISPIDAVRAFVTYSGLMQDAATLEAFESLSGPRGLSHSFNFRGTPLGEVTSMTEDVTASLCYAHGPNKEPILAWRVNLNSESPRYAHYVAHMSAEGDSVPLAINDLVDWFAPERFEDYLVYDIPVLDPLDGSRVRGRAVDRDLSPLGWHDQGNGNSFTDTRGNNVFSQENWNGDANWANNYRPSGGSQLSFNYPVDFAQQPRTYADAAIANLHFWNNIIHDIFQKHGFDEASGNFQENNFERGGRDRDAVQANAQDGAGFNNANFATPIDGSRPRMRMYLWNGFNPMRDGDLDSAIIVHEYGHGISQRLTGGPLNVGCLGAGQAGGMGEGWGDWWGIMFQQRATTTRDQVFPMGLYAAGRGIRYFPYSAQFERNPQTYGFLNGGRQEGSYVGVHAIGSVWCTILFTVYFDMRDRFGFDPDWYYGTSGNNIFFQNVLDGLKLQPCTPNFIQARDAIMQADLLNFQGNHQCTMWWGFARRGLGVSARSNGANNVVEAFDIPQIGRAHV